MSNVTLALTSPIIQGSEEIKELSFRDATAKDLRGMPMEPKQGDFLDLGGILCAQSPSVMNKLSVKDYMKVLEIVAGFISGGQETGENG